MFNKKKRFFNKKIGDVTKSIWELDFKVAQSAQVREGVRRDRDQQLDRLAQLEAQVKGADKKDKEAITAQIEETKANATRFEAQMKMIDDQINGVKASQESDGQVGILETISSLAELREMYKDYVSKI